MSSEIDLTGETDPTDRMTEIDEQARERAERDENRREAGYDGSVKTKIEDLQEALDDL